MANNDPYIESIPGYALGCLEESEREQLERHLAECPECQAELRAYQSLSQDLALTVPAKVPPTRLRQAILQKTGSLAGINAGPKRESWWARLFFTLQPAWGAVSLVLIVVLSASTLFFWQKSQIPPDVQNTFHVIELKSPSNAPQASALLVIDNVGHFGSLVTDQLQPLDDNQSYQLWLVKDNVRTDGGVFSVNNSGYGWLKVDSKVSLLQFQSFGVTIEPKGGSPGPTGLKVLGGNFAFSK